MHNLLYSPKYGHVVQNVRFSGFFLFPGSFNPVHEGHRQLAKSTDFDLISSDIKPSCTVYEMSVSNVDKANISSEKIYQRLEEFTDSDFPVLITKTPMFIDKIQHFYLEKETEVNKFIIGFDTFERLFQPKYYNQETTIDAFIEKISEKNVAFFVAGRYNSATKTFMSFSMEQKKEMKAEDDSVAQSVNKFGIPLEILRRYNVPEAIFDRIHPLKSNEGEDIRVDISSTDIRKMRGMD